MSYDVETATLQQQTTAVVRGHVDKDAVADFLGGAFGEVMALLGRQGRTPTGHPFARYVATDDGFDVEAGFPVAEGLLAEGRVEIGSLPGGLTARTIHVGDYGGVGAAHQAVGDWLTENGYAVHGAPWECYLDGPEVAAPRTEVFFPCERVHPVHPA